jgi:hypothetical protein
MKRLPALTLLIILAAASGASAQSAGTGSGSADAGAPGAGDNSPDVLPVIVGGPRWPKLKPKHRTDYESCLYVLDGTRPCEPVGR